MKYQRFHSFAQTRRNRFATAVVFVCICFSSSGSYEPAAFKSQSKATALLELYTSEGCGSCPSADEWLSGLKTSPALWKTVVPVAFHVDYWNRLGWTDPWASKEFTDRQYGYAEAWGTGDVYTPAFVLNGREWKEWGEKRQIHAPPNSTPVGILNARQGARWEFNLDFTPLEVSHRHWEIHAALLGMGLRSNVLAGENRGKILDHDFTVIEYQKKKMTDGLTRFTSTVFFHSEDKTAGQYAVAFWVSREGELSPVQAVGGYLP